MGRHIYSFIFKHLQRIYSHFILYSVNMKINMSGERQGVASVATGQKTYWNPASTAPSQGGAVRESWYTTASTPHGQGRTVRESWCTAASTPPGQGRAVRGRRVKDFSDLCRCQQRTKEFCLRHSTSVALDEAVQWLGRSQSLK